jgi:hypothetical protein
LKWERLKTWVADATAKASGPLYRAMLVREEDWDKQLVKNFEEAKAAFEVD